MSDSDKPGSALEAVEQASAAGESAPEPSDSSSEDTQELSQPEEQAEAAPIEPTGEGSASPDAKGPIPFERHEKVLAKARAEAAEKEKAFEEYKARVSWAEQVDQAQLQQQQALVQELQGDPVAFLQKLRREIEAHPHLGPQLNQPAEFQLPEPVLRSEDGKAVYTVEQLQQIREHDQAQFEAKLAQTSQSLEGRIDQLAQVEQQRAMVQQAQQTSVDIMTRMRGLPHFKEHEKDVQKVFAEMGDRHRQIGVEGAVIEAYNTVLLSKVLPSLKKASKAETLDTLHKKAAAGTVDPSSGAAVASSRPKNARELEKFLQEREAR